MKGIAYLVSQQQDNGGWSQGTESVNMGRGMDNIATKPNVGDTCMAALALVRAGNYPNAGEYAKRVNKAANFVCDRVEKSDNNSLSVADVQGTRIQMKLGPNIDTFLASLFLSEVVKHMPDKEGGLRVGSALDKVVAKMEHNQLANGNWAVGGWAPVHAQSIATKGLNRAKQVGIAVRDDTLAKAEDFALQSFDGKTGQFAAPGSAPVPLYAAGGTLGSLQESINTNRKSEEHLKQVAASKSAPEVERVQAKATLSRFAATEATQHQALDAVSARLGDSRFTAGFGCNGGEEFLSYLDISEALRANDMTKWADWDKKITDNLNHIQNADGSWMGQHCITSKTFVTAAALLVLLSDRSESQTMSKLKRTG
jgi:hypothetical protein